MNRLEQGCHLALGLDVGRNAAARRGFGGGLPGGGGIRTAGFVRLFEEGIARGHGRAETPVVFTRLAGFTALVALTHGSWNHIARITGLACFTPCAAASTTAAGAVFFVFDGFEIDLFLDQLLNVGH